MTEIKIIASQITEVLMQTQLIEGKSRLLKYYSFFHCLEGKPVIELIGDNNFRLITYHENYEFYSKYKPNIPFDCIVKIFNTNADRYLELLKQLFHGKARSSFNNKYIIIDILLLSLSPKEIATKIGVTITEIQKYIFADKYKEYLEFAMKINKRTIMEDVIKYFNSKNIFKETTKKYLLELVISQNSALQLTRNKWIIIKWVLERISNKFILLQANDQIEILIEIYPSGMNVLNNHFSLRCDQFLMRDNLYNNGDDFYQPPPIH
ncbi:hypothetical protein CEQ21_04740 [Niallia circulans]|uniref:Uncharacterized protein n=1 Tax=Niallia circulans TaxID=1397 RepID=A0A553STC4_NIACI|nr:hypothetical protein [Niallia circulans]TRZ40249.1 hypothetical protein CEQ21_04740 [Niallia circulans]